MGEVGQALDDVDVRVRCAIVADAGELVEVGERHGGNCLVELGEFVAGEEAAEVLTVRKASEYKGKGRDVLLNGVAPEMGH